MSEERRETMTDHGSAGADQDTLHWLVRPATIRKLWWGFAAVLALTVLAQAFTYVKGYFQVDGWFGFGAVYGFASCLAMVLVAKGLGMLLKRPGDYYQPPGDEAADGSPPGAGNEASGARRDA